MPRNRITLNRKQGEVALAAASFYVEAALADDPRLAGMDLPALRAAREVEARLRALLAEDGS